jgi:hypothetical protein
MMKFKGHNNTWMTIFVMPVANEYNKKYSYNYKINEF